VPGAYAKTYGAYSIPTGFTYNPLNFLAKWWSMYAQSIAGGWAPCFPVWL
jgi:hypothetical protein